MRLETLVQQQYDRMSTSEHMVWQYICYHRQECQTMSLHQLADACQVSHTSVLRFLQLIGMDGFNEFKIFLKWEDRKQIELDERHVRTVCFDLTRTINSAENADYTELFRCMDAAGCMYAYGTGSIQKSAARILKNNLIPLGRLVNIIEGQEERDMAQLQMKPNDLMFLFSASGNNQQMNAYAAKIKQRGVRLVAICQDGVNDLAQLCDFYLPFYTQRFDVGEHSTPYYSVSGMVNLAEIMVLKYASYQLTMRNHSDEMR